MCTASNSASHASNAQAHSQQVVMFTVKLGSHIIGLASNQSRASFVITVPQPVS